MKKENVGKGPVACCEQSYRSLVTFGGQRTELRLGYEVSSSRTSCSFQSLSSMWFY